MWKKHRFQQWLNVPKKEFSNDDFLMSDSLPFHWSKFNAGVLHFPATCSPQKTVRRLPMVTIINLKSKYYGQEKYSYNRLTDEQFGWLRALSRRSKRSQSEVVRSLIEHGTVQRTVTRENLEIIRKLIGESTNLNQLAKRANAYGFYRVADECRAVAQEISQLIKQLKDDR